MIIKSFEINRKKFDKEHFFLIYGENEGLKNEIIKLLSILLKRNSEVNSLSSDESSKNIETLTKTAS